LRDIAKSEARRIRDARIDLEIAEDDMKRKQILFRSGVATELDRMVAEAKCRKAQERRRKAQLPIDEGRLEVLKRALESVERDFNIRWTELETKQVARRGEVETIQKELSNLLAQREQAELRAPIDGMVTRGDVKVGDILAPGKPAVEIAPGDDLLVELTVDSEDVGQLRTGMPVRIKFDAYDFQSYGVLSGKVSFIAPDSQVAGESQQSQRAVYKVKVELDSLELGRGEFQGRIKLGMTAQAEIVTERRSLLAILASKIHKTISLN
jgi:HlyD family secretion protein